MIFLLDTTARLLSWAASFVFFWILKTFLPLRSKLIAKITAFMTCSYIFNTYIYPNDLVNLLGALLALFFYLLLFHRGRLIEKISAMLVFYPAFIAVNFLMLDTGSMLFFGTTNAASDIPFTPEQTLISTGIHTISVLIRLLFWLIAWLALKKFMEKFSLNLSTRMWLLVDVLIITPFIAVFTIIYYVPQANTVIAYPICGAAIFSSFGCLYLTSYIGQTMELRYLTDKLELKHSYYEDKLKEEERVRRIYHDLKNHLLILQSGMLNNPETQKSIQALQTQIEGYENYCHTGNDYLDILVRDKARIAMEKHIDFSVVIHFEDASFIEPLDISTIFGNALDNAIEASIKLSPQNRVITAKADRIRDMLSIRIENNIGGELNTAVRTTKPDSFAHGFGLSNIRNAVEKYDGQCIEKVVNESFRLQIMIPIPTKN